MLNIKIVTTSAFLSAEMWHGSDRTENFPGPNTIEKYLSPAISLRFFSQAITTGKFYLTLPSGNFLFFDPSLFAKIFANANAKILKNSGSGLQPGKWITTGHPEIFRPCRPSASQRERGSGHPSALRGSLSGGYMKPSLPSEPHSSAVNPSAFRAPYANRCPYDFYPTHR